VPIQSASGPKQWSKIGKFYCHNINLVGYTNRVPGGVGMGNWTLVLFFVTAITEAVMYK